MSNKPEIKFIKRMGEKRELDRLSKLIKKAKCDLNLSIVALVVYLFLFVFISWIDYKLSSSPYASYSGEGTINKNNFSFYGSPLEVKGLSGFLASIEKFVIPLLVFALPLIIQDVFKKNDRFRLLKNKRNEMKYKE